jgi:hypothetical protein
MTTVDAEITGSHIATSSSTDSEDRDREPQTTGKGWATQVVEPLPIQATPCDPRTRQTLGQRMHEFSVSYNSRRENRSKNRWRRTAPPRKRGDSVKQTAIQRAAEARASRRELRASLEEQLDEVADVHFVNRMPDFA